MFFNKNLYKNIIVTILSYQYNEKNYILINISFNFRIQNIKLGQ